MNRAHRWEGKAPLAISNVPETSIKSQKDHSILQTHKQPTAGLQNSSTEMTRAPQAPQAWGGCLAGSLLCPLMKLMTSALIENKAQPKASLCFFSWDGNRECREWCLRSICPLLGLWWSASTSQQHWAVYPISLRCGTRGTQFSTGHQEVRGGQLSRFRLQSLPLHGA